MQKKNIFLKKFNKSVISITKRIESFFDFFKENFFNKKKRNLKNLDNKIILFVAIIFIFISTYFLLPSFYDQNKIKIQIENLIKEKYNLEVKLDQTLKYSLFPKPHFYSKNVKITYKSNQIAVSENIRISIITKNLFSINKIKIKNLIFKETDFKLDFSNFYFFIDLLNNLDFDKKEKFMNSKLFYLDQNDDILFLSNIKNLNYFIEENFIKKLNAKLNVFNIPISLIIEHFNIKKEFFIKLNSYPLRLSLENYSNYNNEKLDGKLDLTIINKDNKIDYSLKDNSLYFNTQDNEITGNISIKPFFISSNLNLFQINLKQILKENSVLISFLKSEALNNKNLNGKINVNTKNLSGVNFINEIEFNVVLEQGSLSIKDLNTNFKDSVNINLDDTQLIVDENKLKFAGFVTLDFINIKKFFEHYQISIKNRKYIKKIKLGFLYHFDDEFVEIDNLKVDGKLIQNSNQFINDFNSRKDNVFNKIIFRNSVKDFFKLISLE